MKTLLDRIRRHLDQLAGYQRERTGPALLAEAAARIDRDASLIDALRTELIDALHVAYKSDAHWPDSVREVLEDD